jgi:hypothetical protein
MLRKICWLFLPLVLAACSTLPIGGQIVLPSISFVESTSSSSCPAVCPSLPPIYVTCEAPVCPTCAAIATEIAQTETPSGEPTLEPTDETPDVVTGTATYTSTTEITEIPATSTATPVPTNTSMPSSTPTSTATLVPTKTSTPTKTPVPTSTSTQTKTATAIVMQYEVQSNSPVYMQNFAHPELGCNWLGVAGQVFDKSGVPVENLVIVVEGTLNNQSVELLGLTSGSLSSDYGIAPYEIQIASQVLASEGALTVTVYDLSGNLLSLPVAFNTYSDCTKNLVIVNFVD